VVLSAALNSLLCHAGRHESRDANHEDTKTEISKKIRAGRCPETHVPLRGNRFIATKGTGVAYVVVFVFDHDFPSISRIFRISPMMVTAIPIKAYPSPRRRKPTSSSAASALLRAAVIVFIVGVVNSPIFSGLNA
jgi:hypothetical protein